MEVAASKGELRSLDTAKRLKSEPYPNFSHSQCRTRGEDETKGSCTQIE